MWFELLAREKEEEEAGKQEGENDGADVVVGSARQRGKL
jgi:hypothetical protein